jgi:tetratricopeptide (TPR) repeat protein
LTQAGSVLGTPAFMSPEQAGGEIDRIDERSDVFGLGAVLCTLLTGLPPYSGPSGEAVRLLAVRGQTAEAFARLDACGAEPDLVALCKRCLSFAPTNRPANAGELATVVADFRRTSEERARQAELDRAKTEVKAAERRKRRWVLAALAVSMSLLAMLTAGGLGWRWYEKRAEQEVVRKAVTSLVDTAEQAVRDNQTAAAAAALENVGSRLSGYESELPAMHARYETLDRDHRTLLALDRLQTRTEIFERPKWEEYRAVFTENGVRFEDGYREAGERLRASVTSRQLIRVMHQHYTSWNFRDAGSKEMIAALDVADPDPFRVRLRQAVHGENPRDVAGVMASATSEQRSVESVGWLLRTGFLPLAERRELGLELLSRQPNDYETLVDMAFLEEDAGRREADLIIGYWRAALAARPQSAFSHIAVGEAARRLKQDLPTAKAHFREAILLAPSDGTPWSHLGRVLTAEKNSDEAIRAHEKAIELSPNLALSHYQLAFLYAEREDEGRSAAALRTAVKLDDTLVYGGYGVEEGRMPSLIRLVRKLVRELPDDAELHWVLSQFLRNSGDQQAARPHAEPAAKLDPQSHRFWYDLGIIYTDLSDAEAALTAFHSHHQLKPDDPSRRTKVGETLVALHRYEEAVTEFREVLDETDDDEARRGLGKALVALGKMDEGLKQFRRDYTFDDTPFGKLVSKRLIQDLAVHFPHEALTVCRRILNDHPTWGEDWEYCSFLRYEAACYALRCSVQDGKDVPAIIDSAALRNEAFAWLRDDFTARGRAAGLDTEYRSWLHDMLEHYLTDKDLAPVRDPAELAKLSESERQAWGQLWADVRKLHADTAPPREVLPPPRRVQ